MKSLSPLLSRITAVALLFGAAGAVYLGIVAPLTTHRQAAEESIEQSKAILSSRPGQRGQVETLRSQLDALKKTDGYRDGLLKGANEALVGAYLQNTLKRMASVEKGVLKSVQILPPVPENKFKRMTARAQVSLTPPALRKFLYSIENTKPFLFIDNLDIRQERQVLTASDLSADVALLVRLDVYGFMQGTK